MHSVSVFVIGMHLCPPTLSLSISVCLPSPYLYALPPSTLSLTPHYHFILSSILPFSLFLSDCGFVLCLSLPALLCLCLLFIVFLTIPQPHILPSSLVFVVIVVYHLQQEPGREEREEIREIEGSGLHFLPVSSVNTYSLFVIYHQNGGNPKNKQKDEGNRFTYFVARLKASRGCQRWNVHFNQFFIIPD